MGYPYTDTGYNMFDMLSMIQKAIRRGDYENAGFAAKQLKNSFRTAMWNRLFVISAEDCFGIVTKELVKLREMDDASPDNRHISNAVALLCRAKKSRDACYFSCNFVLASRNPRQVPITQEEIENLYGRINNGTRKDDGTPKVDKTGFYQMSMFDDFPKDEDKTDMDEKEIEKHFTGAMIQKAIQHRDMDMTGYGMDLLRRPERNFLWDVMTDYAENFIKVPVTDEIRSLRKADGIVNKNKKDKDEIFISKAAVLLFHCNNPAIHSMNSSDIVQLENLIDWGKFRVKPMEECVLPDGNIPEWVYDCHTLKGRKIGKTDWDMTVTEQAALYPLQKGYFDDASWLYTYEDDLRMGVITEDEFEPIKEFAKTHEANPVKFLPYETTIGIGKITE